jgi:hypothetical protein
LVPLAHIPIQEKQMTGTAVRNLMITSAAALVGAMLATTDASAQMGQARDEARGSVQAETRGIRAGRDGEARAFAQAERTGRPDAQFRATTSERSMAQARGSSRIAAGSRRQARVTTAQVDTSLGAYGADWQDRRFVRRDWDYGWSRPSSFGVGFGAGYHDPYYSYAYGGYPAGDAAVGFTGYAAAYPDQRCFCR